MKSSLLLMILIFPALFYAQDTLYTSQGKIIGKVVKISDSEIEYRKSPSPDGPLYVIRKERVQEIRYADGTRDVFSAPFASQDSTARPTGRRNTIFFGVYGILYENITVGYERRIDQLLSLEFTAGLMNSTMLERKPNLNSTYTHMGGNYRLGLKQFFRSNRYETQGNRAVAASGFYLFGELSLAHVLLKGVESRIYKNNTWVDYETDVRCFSSSVHFGMGYKLVFEERISLSTHGGLGYGVGWGSFSNPTYEENTGKDPSRYYQSLNYGSHLFTNVMSLTGVFRLGWSF